MQLHHWESGAGQPLLCVHETAAVADVWRPLADAIGERARTIAVDRRGWGASGAPEPYLRTTVQEQSEDVAEQIEELDAAPAIVCGAGIGAVAALDLALRRPADVRAAVLVEPPLFAFVPEATEVLSADGEAVRDAFQAGGAARVFEVYLTGALSALGPGAERIPEAIAAAAARRPMTLFAELAAVPAWDLPFKRLPSTVPVEVVVATSTPALVRAASEALAARLGPDSPREIETAGLPQYDGAAELAELVLGLA